MHYPHPSKLALLAVLIGLAWVPFATASGSYPPAPPRLPAEALRRIDTELYTLGKLIYTGRANLPSDAGLPAADVVRIRRELATVQNSLPDRAKEQVDLPGMARSLTIYQSDALTYYVRTRYPSK